MKTLKYLAIGLTVGVTAVCNVTAQFYHIEPDNYTNGTLLNTILPQVTMVTTDSNNVPYPFDVRASYDGFGYASTGSNVFAHGGGVTFWNTDRRMRMDFISTIGFLAIDFSGGEFFSMETGRLDAFNASGVLIGSYTTSPRAAGSVETMAINRAAMDIKYAVAYVPPNLGVFGRLDNLVFSPIPEPGSATIVLVGAALWAGCKRAGFGRKTRRDAGIKNC